MSTTKRCTAIGFLLLVLWHSQNLAWSKTVVQFDHDWTFEWAGSYYGLAQFRAGAGILDAHTMILLGPVEGVIPVPIFVLLVIVCGAIGFPVGFFLLGRRRNKPDAT